MLLAIILTLAFFASLLALACCRAAADADAHFRPQQGAPGSDSERDGGAQQHNREV